jgi:CMP-N-acetylneuraminic acid synthetase
MNDVLEGTLRQVQTDLVLQTHSTNPLLRPETIRRAIDELRNAASDHDSLFSVTRRHVRLWTAEAQPLNHDPEKLLRTQDLPAVLEENSCLYLFSPNVLASTGSRIGRRPLLYAIPALEAVDIDDEADLLLAEALLERRSVTTMRHTLPTGVEWNETSAF